MNYKELLASLVRKIICLDNHEHKMTRIDRQQLIKDIRSEAYGCGNLLEEEGFIIFEQCKDCGV